jgi:hypothetical protein
MTTGGSELWRQAGSERGGWEGSACACRVAQWGMWGQSVWAHCRGGPGDGPMVNQTR